MRILALQLVFIAVYIQVRTCYPSCTLHNLVADCMGRHLYSVPALPPNITHIYLEFNHISEINRTSFQDFEHLQQLDLGNQRVQLIIRNNAFLRQRKLTRLVLGNNIQLQLEPRAFAGLSKLQYLDLGYCNLDNSILAERYLQPLLSLETLDLFGNKIVRLQPGPFFSRLTNFTQLNLKLNQIDRLCEEDLAGFRGKNFTLLNLESNHLDRMFGGDLDWKKCGNPFRGMAFNILDLSSNGFSVNRSRQFFKAIEGTQIHHLIYSGHMGKDFSHDNLRDPDKNTFEGLMNSAIEILDLSKSRIFALQIAVFSPLNNAKIIDISQNKINRIDRNAFDGQVHLRMLNLSYNLLGEIHSYTFTNLTDLRVLDLSYNHIGVLGYKAFSGLSYLRDLNLTGNSLRDLGFPVSLPNLDFLLLGDNKLKSLSSIVDLGMNSIYVNVEGNTLTNLEDVYVILTHFKRLQKLYYGGNFIKWCSSNITIPLSNSLQVLDLHDISLHTIWTQGKCLDLFDHLENLVALDLSLNSLAALPEGIFRGLSSIIELNLSSNALTYLQQDIFPVSLKRLDLSKNFLHFQAFPDPTTFQSLLFLSLAENRFDCNCNLESFLTWLNVTNITFLSPVEDYRCEFPLPPSSLHNLPLLNYSTIVEPCEEDDKFALFIFSTLLVITVILSGIVYARLRGHIFIIYKKVIGRVLEGPKPPPPEEEVQYDVFLCFSNNDYKWVEAALLKKLDKEFSENNILRCCFEARDFIPGVDHLSNNRDAIWSSRKTVCIVSKEFLKDGWCLEVFTLAQGRMLEELTNILIMLVVGEVAHYQLMKCNAVRAFVKRKDYLIWPNDPQDLEWFYERLISQILKNSKVKKPAEDKPLPDIQPQNEDEIQLENIGPIAV
ncbi:LOW QUALITY PROTEIN: toll-like receptor 5 [Scomber japonicus]|uniref:LOW QUALITY PROTEIN: toll-like receptor 5 n=1 Tax=Scomber japonicus TaxID=13676 RepID=UPI0023053B8B|nr:LOW QUALITY PROTEIN: toll-like receptor 5 [Scomber japonicus]